MTSVSSVEPSQLQALVDRESIREVIHRYCRAVDRCDADLLTSCYHEDGIEDHGGFFIGPRDEWVRSTMDSVREMCSATTHMVMNITIELEGDEAYAETYVLAGHEWPDQGAGMQFKWLGGRYIDRFVRRDGTWRILKRALVVDWTHGEPLSVAFGQGALDGNPTAELVLRRGVRSRKDLGYLESARALLG
jgi:hypothetical protein